MKEITTWLLAIALATTGVTFLLQTNANTNYDVIVSYTKPTKVATSQTQTSPPLSSTFSSSMVDNFSTDQAETKEEVVFPLELNFATVEELEQIPKIGSVTAQRIVQYREILGGYDALEQLQDIRGIGDNTFTEISRYLYLEE